MENLIFGAFAQKSRMCFAGSIRDVILMKNFDLLTVIVGLFVVMLIYNIAKVDGDHVQAVKNVSVNEEIFSHCPDDYAVMPESLLCEIVAQSGCALVLSRPENVGKIGYFMSIDRAEIFEPVFPGDFL